MVVNISFGSFQHRLQTKNLLSQVSRNGSTFFPGREYYAGDFEVRQILALNQGCLEEGYAWESHMLTPFITGLPGHPFSGFALDIFNTDLDAVIEAISRKIKCEDLSKDNLGRFFYGNTELKEINCSPIRRAVLDELLRSKNHTITAEKISELLDQLHYKYPDNTHTRVKVMSETKQALRGVSHNVDIEPGKSGRNVDYYELVIKKESF